jgi:hypothetical protein
MVQHKAMRIVSRDIAITLAALSLMGSDVAAAAPVENVIYSFQGSPDGQRPFGPMSLVADDDGNLYGATFFGGICPSLNGANNINNCGTVFKLTSKGKTTLTETIQKSDRRASMNVNRPIRPPKRGSWRLSSFKCDSWARTVALQEDLVYNVVLASGAGYLLLVNRCQKYHWSTFDESFHDAH